jgi:hypothetical protein
MEKKLWEEQRIRLERERDGMDYVEWKEQEEEV